MLDNYMEKKRCIVYDGTMKSIDKNIYLIEKFYSAGYEIDILFIDCDLVLANVRAVLRAVKTGRKVAAEVVRDSNYLSAKTIYMIYKSHINKIHQLTIMNASLDEDYQDQVVPIYKMFRTEDKIEQYIYNEEKFENFETKALTAESQFVTLEKLHDQTIELGGKISGH